MVHELVPTIFELAATPSYKDDFANSYGSATLFISTCFQLQKLSVWVENGMF